MKIIAKLWFIRYLCVIMEFLCGMKRGMKKEIFKADWAKVGMGVEVWNHEENKEKKRIKEEMRGLFR